MSCVRRAGSAYLAIERRSRIALTLIPSLLLLLELPSDPTSWLELIVKLIDCGWGCTITNWFWS